MNINWAINEINLLENYYKEKKAYKNICKALKDIVLSYGKFDTSMNTTMYISEQVSYLYQNKTGDIDKDLDFCKDHLKSLYKMAEEQEQNLDIQAKVNNVIIQIMTILILVKNNKDVIYNYTMMLLDNRPLTPITDIKDEWEDVSQYFDNNKIVFQNLRARNVYMYKYNDDIEVEMIDAKYFSKDEGNTWELNEDSSLRLKLPTMIPRSEFIIVK